MSKPFNQVKELGGYTTQKKQLTQREMQSALVKKNHHFANVSDIFYLKNSCLKNNYLKNSFSGLRTVVLSADKQKDRTDKSHDSDFVVLPISPPIDLPLPPPDPPASPDNTHAKLSQTTAQSNHSLLQRQP